MKKVIESIKEYIIRFTDEELEELNLKEGDQLSYEIKDSGILFKKYEELEIDLSEFPKDILELIIKESNSKNMTISEYFEFVLTQFINKTDILNDKYLK
jgi:hypothetical protein